MADRLREIRAAVERDTANVETAYADRAWLLQEVERLRAGLESLRRDWHATCDDAWYSCPKSPEGCADDQQTGCTCGNDALNAQIAAILNPPHR